MNDLISRRAAIKAIDDLPNCYNGYSDTYDKACIIGVLEEVPTAEPKKGKWIPKTLYPLSFSDGECKDCVQCSNCKTHWDFETNYCPNCGARMEGREE